MATKHLGNGSDGSCGCRLCYDPCAPVVPCQQTGPRTTSRSRTSASSRTTSRAPCSPSAWPRSTPRCISPAWWLPWLIVVRSAGLEDSYLSWAVFAGLIVSGLTTMLQTARRPRLGSGHLLVMGPSRAFLAVAITALVEGGPALLATLRPVVVVGTVQDRAAPVHPAPVDHADGVRHRHHADPCHAGPDHLRPVRAHPNRNVGRGGAGWLQARLWR